MFRVSAALFLYTLCFGWGNAALQNGVESLLDIETLYMRHFESYVESVQQTNDKIKRFLDYVDVVHADLEDPEEYFGNPLNAFTALNRLVNNWKREVLDVVLANKDYEDYNRKLHKELIKHHLEEPTNQDLLDATGELMELQQSNDLPTSAFANDILYTDEAKNENVTFSASDCYVIGRYLYQLQHYDYASEWLLQARSHASRQADSFPNVKQLQILEYLAPALQELGSYKLANRLNNEILRAVPAHEAALKNKPILEGTLVLQRSDLRSLKDEL